MFAGRDGVVGNRLASEWMNRVSNPGVKETFHTHPEGSLGPHSLV
jgi:hypothetical protein